MYCDHYLNNPTFLRELLRALDPKIWTNYCGREIRDDVEIYFKSKYNYCKYHNETINIPVVPIPIFYFERITQDIFSDK